MAKRVSAYRAQPRSGCCFPSAKYRRVPISREAAESNTARRKRHKAATRPAIRPRSWASAPAGRDTCRSSGRGGGDGAVRRNPCPRHRWAASAHRPNGACRDGTARVFLFGTACPKTPANVKFSPARSVGSRGLAKPSFWIGGAPYTASRRESEGPVARKFAFSRKAAGMPRFYPGDAMRGR